MKNFVLAILIAILITYSFGLVAHEWFDFSIQLDEHMLGPFESVIGMTIVGVIMAIVGLIVAVSIFGALAIGIVAALFAFVVAGVSVFWPMILVIAIIVWLVKDKRPARY
jgi:hypothetical protein